MDDPGYTYDESLFSLGKTHVVRRSPLRYALTIWARAGPPGRVVLPLHQRCDRPGEEHRHYPPSTPTRRSVGSICGAAGGAALRWSEREASRPRGARARPRVLARARRRVRRARNNESGVDETACICAQVELELQS